VLEIENLSVSYGGLTALSGVSLRVSEDDFVSVIGANGAGKSTLFKAISGAVPSSGSMRFTGADLTKVRPCHRPHLGISHVPEGRQVFAAMSVFENLQLGAYTAEGRANWTINLDKIYSMFPILSERRNQLAGSLSGGEQQMLAIARGLAASPKLLMLDEPSLGLAPSTVEMIFERIDYIHKHASMAILLVEQRVGEALQLCKHGYVLESGRVALEGTYDVIASDNRVRTAYLGL
jgi:branched-chain amino acid transport system ATP-binding protein